MQAGKWTLAVGVHDGDCANRDTIDPRAFDTEAELMSAFLKMKAYYGNYGYVIWFARKTDPHGNITMLEQNFNYI